MTYASVKVAPQGANGEDGYQYNEQDACTVINTCTPAQVGGVWVCQSAGDRINFTDYETTMSPSGDACVGGGT